MAALATASPAAALLTLDEPSESVHRVPAGGPSRVNVTVPFRLSDEAGFYAKLLVTPWNPVNSGEPNGTLTGDSSSGVSVGVSGWWVEFAVADEEGRLLTRDARGEPVAPGPRARVDSTPTPLITLEAGAYQLRIVVRVPAEAGAGSAVHRVPFALVERGEAEPGSRSGATMDASRGFVVAIVTGEAEPPPAVPPPPPPASPLGQPQTAAQPPATLGWLLAALILALGLLYIFLLGRKRDREE